MKLPLFTLLACALFAGPVLRAENHPFKESFSQSGTFSSTGKITLENINGDIEVETWDKNEISIEGQKSARTEEELKLIDLKIDRSESRVDIKVHLPKRKGGMFGNSSIRGGVSFKLKVPVNTNLERIKTVNSSINIAGIRGPVDAETVNGNIRAQNLGGSARLSSVNGGLRASFARVAAQQELSFDTVNGSIEVILPENAGAEVRSQVVNGHIDCEFPIESQGGRVSGKRLAGKIGDGRAALSAESVNGGVRIKRS